MGIATPLGGPDWWDVTDKEPRGRGARNSTGAGERGRSTVRRFGAEAPGGRGEGGRDCRGEMGERRLMTYDAQGVAQQQGCCESEAAPSRDVEPRDPLEVGEVAGDQRQVVHRACRVAPLAFRPRRISYRVMIENANRPCSAKNCCADRRT